MEEVCPDVRSPSDLHRAMRSVLAGYALCSEARKADRNKARLLARTRSLPGDRRGSATGAA